VPPDDADAFVAALRGLLDDAPRRAAAGASGRRWVVEHASPAAVGAAYDRLLRSLTT
jgi:colanic acid biosynthesis glycosyl transferase WcaI